MTEGYSSISLPKSFIKKIDMVVENTSYGYSSRAEFVKEAIREHLKTFKVYFEEKDQD